MEPGLSNASDVFSILPQSLRTAYDFIDWITRVAAPDAPGFRFFAGATSGASLGLSGDWPTANLSGKGFDESQALASCVGEGAEHLSRLEWGDETVMSASLAAAEHGLDEAEAEALSRLLPPGLRERGRRLDWLEGRRLRDGVATRLPVDLCLRRQHPSDRPMSALSTGCAAGPTFAAAALAALHEAVERDAIALWWAGARPPRLLDSETLDALGGPARFAALRAGARGRSTWLLDITTDISIPAVVAISTTTDGDRFALGGAANLDLGLAVQGALLELCQSELGHHLVNAKRVVRGEAALNEADRRKLGRGRRFIEAAAGRLFGQAIARGAEATPPADVESRLELAVARLAAIGVSPVVVDLTRPRLGVPVARVAALGLQPYPSQVVTDRLARALGGADDAFERLVRAPLF